MSLCASATLLLTLATIHPSQEALQKLEWLTPGVAIRCLLKDSNSSYLEAGTYRNSYRSTSVYGAILLHTPVPRTHILIGAVTGYSAGLVIPAAALVVALQENTELTILPGFKLGNFSPEWAVSVRWKIAIH